MHRRSFVTGLALGAAAAAVPGPLPARTQVVELPDREPMQFRIYRKGEPIGTRKTLMTPTGDGFTVDTTVEMAVGLAFVTVWRYRHEAREVWRHGRLAELETETDDDGSLHRVRGSALNDRFKIWSTEGDVSAPPDVMTSNDLWTMQVLDQRRVVNAQKGLVVPVTTSPGESGFIEVLGRQTLVTQYRTKIPGTACHLAYDRAGTLVGAEVMSRDETIVLRAERGLASG